MNKVSTQLRMEKYIPCEFFFKVESRIVSPTLPPRAGLTLDAFKRYILLCRRDGVGKNSVWSGPRDARVNGGIKRSRGKEGALIKELMDKHFIETVDRDKSRYNVLIAPRYHPTEKKFIKSEDLKRTARQLKDSDNGYIIVPYEIVDNGYLAEMSGRQMLVLLKLYEHNYLHCWGGVDPNVIHSISGNENWYSLIWSREIKQNLKLEKNLYEDIGLTYGQFMTTLRRLVWGGLVRIQPIVCELDSNGDLQYLYDYIGQQIEPGYKKVWVLRPTYQFVEHWEAWKKKNEGDIHSTRGKAPGIN